jgi:laminin G domain protein
MRFFQGPSVALQRWVLLVAVLLAASAFVGVESAFAAWTKMAAWRMNEGPNDPIMHDTSGNHHWGLIGSAVETGVVVSGDNRAYRWPAGNVDGARPERLVKVKSNRALNPRRDAFAVVIRLFTGAGDQNILQKGQSKTAGGMFKIDMLRGHVICTFKGGAGRAAIGSRQTVWDNAWHTVRCERRPTGVTIIVDGDAPRTQAGRTGWIANNWALVIGGKSVCGGTVQCDYFVGLLDSVVVQRG